MGKGTAGEGGWERGKEERRGDRNPSASSWGSLRKETEGAAQTTLGMPAPAHKCPLTSLATQPWGWRLVVPAPGEHYKYQQGSECGDMS